MAGSYNQPRILTLILDNDETIELVLNLIKIKRSSKLLSSTAVNDIEIITVNNSFKNNGLVIEFDKRSIIY